MSEKIADASRIVPIHLPAKMTALQGGAIVLRRARFGPLRATLARLAKTPADVTAHLDPIAATAYQHIDGIRTMRDILAYLHDQYPDEDHMADRLGRLMSELVSQKFVAFA